MAEDKAFGERTKAYVEAVKEEAEIESAESVEPGSKESTVVPGIIYNDRIKTSAEKEAVQAQMFKSQYPKNAMDKAQEDIRKRHKELGTFEMFSSSLRKKAETQELTPAENGLLAVVDQFENSVKNGDDEQTQAILKQLELMGQGGRAASVKLSYDMLKDMYNAKKDFQKTFIDTTLDEYFLANGNLDIDYINKRAKSIVGDKPQTSRMALDKLQEQGPTQLEMPEIPKNHRAALTEIIVASLADIGTNIAAMAGVGNLRSKALADTASQKAFDSVSNMLAMDLAQYQEKKDKVMKLNAELMDKYKGDLVNAWAEFEQRASNDERAYTALRINAVQAEIGRAYQMLGLKESSDAALANIASGIENIKNQEEITNKGYQQQMELKRLEVARQAWEWMTARDRAKEIERQKRIAGLDNLGKNGMMMSVAGIDSKGAYDVAINTIASLPQNENNANILANGRAIGVQALQAIRDSDLTTKQRKTAVHNLINLASYNNMPKDFTPATLRALGGGLVQYDPKTRGFTLPGSNTPDLFRYVGNVAPQAMNMMLIEQVGNAYDQNAKFIQSTKAKGQPATTIEEIDKAVFGGE